MALKDQPYIPLYVQDIMTDEKLNECCAATHGVYIKGIMCLMHKSKTYGKILLKQKYKQTESMSRNFALQIEKHLPYSADEIEIAINELLKEDVCQLEDDFIVQKRMVEDNRISEIRSNAGKKGGGNPQFVSNFVKTKVQTNYEYENENEIEDKIENKKENRIKRENIFKEEVFSFSEKYSKEMLQKFFNYWSEPNKSGTKMKWELQQTFEISRRLVTWANKSFTKTTVNNGRKDFI